MGLIVTALASYLHMNASDQLGRSLARLRSDDMQPVVCLGPPLMNTPTSPSAWPHGRSPFYPAELALQERFGHRQTLEAQAGGLFEACSFEQHRQFYAQLPFSLVGSVDATGQPWASMLAASPGFLHSPDSEHLRFNVEPNLRSRLLRSTSADLLWKSSKATAPSRSKRRVQPL
jgi:hypothetical protein